MSKIAFVKICIFTIFACVSKLSADSAESSNATSTAKENLTLLELQDISMQDSTTSNDFLVLQPYKAFYIMPAYYSFSTPALPNKDIETKFQISFKMPLFQKKLSGAHKLFFAYTQTAWFQNYNKPDSRPFRDIDYQPEFFYSYENLNVLDGIDFGYIHTSNGEKIERSRTQNRLNLTLRWKHNFKASKREIGINASVWNYIGTRGDGFIHDNVDLPKYRGYGDLYMYFKGSRNMLEAYARPHIRYPFLQLGYIIRISNKVGIYVQYTQGYGDSLFEYNVKSQRLGIGLRMW